MSSVSPISLNDLERYAQTYFPNEFSKLPSLTSLTWATDSSHRTSTQRYLKTAPLRLLIGKCKHSHHEIWAYQATFNQFRVYSMSTSEKRLRWGCERLWEDFELLPPFQYALRCKSHLTWDRGRDLQTLTHFYFLTKGLVPWFTTPSREQALGEFEWAVRSFACKAPQNNLSADYFGRDSEERMRRIQTTGISGSIDQLARDIPANRPQLAAHARTAASNVSSIPVVTVSTTQSSSTADVPVLNDKRKRPSTETMANDSNADAVPAQRKKHHADLMEELFQERETEAQKPVNHIIALIAEKDALVAKVKQLESQVIGLRSVAGQDKEMFNTRLQEELNSRKKAETESTILRVMFDAEKELRQAGEKAKTSMSTELAAEKKMRAEVDSSSALLRKQLQMSEEKQSEVERKMNEHRAITEAKLKKAGAFYTSQKKLLGLQVKNCAPERKEAIFKAFEEDYGELEWEMEA